MLWHTGGMRASHCETPLLQRPVRHAADGGLPGNPGSGPGGSGLPGGDDEEHGVMFVNPAGQRQTAAVKESGEFELASWWSRVGAALIDGIVMLALLFLVALPVFGVGFSDDDGGLTIGALAVAVLLYALIALLYAPVLMSRWNGATVGKRAVGIRVMRADGAKLGFGDAALREVVFKGLVVNIASQLTVGLAFLANFLWPLWDAENRAGHDFMARTRVVKA